MTKIDTIENCENNNNNSSNVVVTLRNGVEVPLVGLGTSHNGGYSHSSVVYALKECGYRLIDTAKRYGTEEFIRVAVEESGLARNQIFLTSKLWPTDYGLESTRQSFHGSLERLGVDYLDMFLMHYPEVSSTCSDKWQTLADTWRSLEILYDQGLIKAIGVSNFSVLDLEQLMDRADCSMVPLINQIEFHPYQRDQTLVQYCQDRKIQIQGYCPLGNGNLVNVDQVTQISESVGRTPAQVLIRWSLQHQVPTIPKSTKKHRVKENFDVFNFQLSDQQMATLDGLNQNKRYIELDTIQEKIDSNLPDGYRLDKNLRQNLLAS